MKAGKALKLTYTDSNGNEHVITSDHIEGESFEEIHMHGYDSSGWDEAIRGTEWTIEIDVTPIDWDETWLVAYMGRMYANYFNN